MVTLCKRGLKILVIGLTIRNKVSYKSFSFSWTKFSLVIHSHTFNYIMIMAIYCFTLCSWYRNRGSLWYLQHTACYYGNTDALSILALVYRDGIAFSLYLWMRWLADKIDKSTDKIVWFMLSGAYEPPKAAKEHATRFHHNPNYITHLKKNKFT